MPISHRIAYASSLLVLLVAACGCGDGSPGARPREGSPDSSVVTSLAQKYASFFPVGAAVDSQSYTTHADLLAPHFASITTENEMKFDALEPAEGRFDFATADPLVAFAQSHQMKVRGHALVWHSQNPAWLFVDDAGADVTADVLLARMQSHIGTVMGHFKGQVYAWDVVNEAVMDTGALRTGDEARDSDKSGWYKILGDSYIAAAFRFAHAADPGAKLFYNDFHDYVPAKQQGVYNLLKGLLAAGVPVHGVGMQCHLNLEPSPDPANQGYYQSAANLESAIQLYASLGLEVQITELDLSLYITGVSYTPEMFYTTATFTDELQTQQAERYREFFQLFRKYRNAITGVTFWGIADDNTWLSEFSSGRQDFPLLFDVNHQPKRAYYAVVDF